MPSRGAGSVQYSHQFHRMLATGTRGEGSKSVSYMVPSSQPSMKDSNDKPNVTNCFEISSAKIKESHT